jgi:nucleoside-diphosphate-sugar epimerase
MKGKNILITGGLGFIGSNLAIKLAKEGSNVTIIDSLIPEYGGNPHNIHDFKDKIKVNLSDVRDPFSMNQLVQGQDFLFNLAGQTSHLDSMENPFDDLDINAKAQLSILEACRLHNPNLKIVFASTRQIYGKPKYLPVDEKHPSHPVDVNGVNKMAGEFYHMVYSKVYGISSCVLRLTNTYGPHMRVKDARQTFLGIWIRNLIEGKPIQIFGDGQQRRDYNYVEDVIEALLLAANIPEGDGKIFNLGAPEPLSLEKTANLMCKHLEGSSFEKVPFPEARKAIDVGDFICDYAEFKNRFGWKPKISFEEGIQKTIKYYQKHLSHYL